MSLDALFCNVDDFCQVFCRGDTRFSGAECEANGGQYLEFSWL